MFKGAKRGKKRVEFRGDDAVVIIDSHDNKENLTVHAPPNGAVVVVVDSTAKDGVTSGNTLDAGATGTGITPDTHAAKAKFDAVPQKDFEKQNILEEYPPQCDTPDEREGAALEKVLQKYTASANNESATHYGFDILDDLARVEQYRIAAYCKKNPLFDKILHEFMGELQKELKPLSQQHDLLKNNIEVVVRENRNNAYQNLRTKMVDDIIQSVQAEQNKLQNFKRAVNEDEKLQKLLRRDLPHMQSRVTLLVEAPDSRLVRETHDQITAQLTNTRLTREVAKTSRFFRESEEHREEVIQQLQDNQQRVANIYEHLARKHAAWVKEVDAFDEKLFVRTQQLDLLQNDLPPTESVI